jgi:hypothetical protein
MPTCVRGPRAATRPRGPKYKRHAVSLGGPRGNPATAKLPDVRGTPNSPGTLRAVPERHRDQLNLIDLRAACIYDQAEILTHNGRADLMTPA